jgi:hypothetical protein
MMEITILSGDTQNAPPFKHSYKLGVKFFYTTLIYRDSKKFHLVKSD